MSLSRLIHPDDDADDIPDLDLPTSEKATSAEALARLALTAALDRRTRAALRQVPKLTIIKVPTADWVSPIIGAVRDIEPAPYICTATERRKASGVFQRIGGDSLLYLQRGRSVLYISPDPEEILEDAVLIASDIRIEIQPMTPVLLRALIRTVTGSVARGVTEAMTKLDLPVILATVRPDLSAAACVRKLRAAIERQDSPASKVPLLHELPLSRPLRVWSSNVLQDLAAVRSGTMSPRQLTYCTLEGPPGTGKTLIAESLARTAGWNFVPATVGGWFSVGDGALGGVARNMKTFVDLVLASEPCIGLLDEIDAIPDRATMDNRGRSWWTPVITMFLTQVDRVRKSGKSVMLIGTTNHFHNLDPALIRAGRLHQRVPVLPPETEAEVLALFRHYLRGEQDELDLMKVARLAIGCTPATVEAWTNQARGLARAEGRDFGIADLLEQILPRDDRDPADLWAIALHEVGHAVVAHTLGIPVEQISIVADGQSGGHTRTRPATLVPGWAEVENHVTVTLGGRAADIVLGSGPNAGAENDLERATAMVLQALDRQGLGSRIAFRPAILPRSAQSHAELEGHLCRLLDRAIDIVREHRTAALALTSRLLDQRVISGREIDEILVSPAVHNENGS